MDPSYGPKPRTEFKTSPYIVIRNVCIALLSLPKFHHLTGAHGPGLHWGGFGCFLLAHGMYLGLIFCPDCQMDRV